LHGSGEQGSFVVISPFVVPPLQASLLVTAEQMFSALQQAIFFSDVH